MDFFWCIQITAGCVYIFVLCVSVLNLFIIKRNLTSAQDEKIQNIEVLVDVYIEPLINGALFSIVFLNISPMLVSQIYVHYMLTSIELSTFISNLFIFIVFFFVSLGSISVQACLQVVSKNEAENAENKKCCKGWLIFASLGVHSFIEGLNIGIQKSLTSVIILAILTAIHEIFLLPLIILKTFPYYCERWLTTVKVMSMLLYAVCCPFGMVIGSLFMSVISGNIYVLIALIISAGILLYSILASLLFNNNERTDPKEIRKRTLIFNIGLLLVGFLSYIKSF